MRPCPNQQTLTHSRSCPVNCPRADLKHPVPFLQCKTLQMAGISAMVLGFVADVSAVLVLILHCLLLAGLLPSKLGKPLTTLIWFVLTIGFATVCFLAVGVYTATWSCDNVSAASPAILV